MPLSLREKGGVYSRRVRAWPTRDLRSRQVRAWKNERYGTWLRKQNINALIAGSPRPHPAGVPTTLSRRERGIHAGVLCDPPHDLTYSHQDLRYSPPRKRAGRGRRRCRCHWVGLRPRQPASGHLRGGRGDPARPAALRGTSGAFRQRHPGHGFGYLPQLGPVHRPTSRPRSCQAWSPPSLLCERSSR